MVKITYECDETEQKMTITLDENLDGNTNVSIKFDPEIDDGCKDPYGMMGKLMDIFTA